MRDFLTPHERSDRMARVHSRDTKLEQGVVHSLRQAGLRFRKNVHQLPGKPDFLLAHGQVAVFVDSDFWHGWRYPLWQSKLNGYWKAKIEATRARDKRNTRKLRQMGLMVVRVWEHELKKAPEILIERLRKHPTIASTITDHPRRVIRR